MNQETVKRGLWVIAAILVAALLVKRHVVPALLVAAFVASPLDDILIGAFLFHK